MAAKFYVVWHGRQNGIYNDWASCKRQIHEFAGARFKAFPTQAEAERAFKSYRPTPTIASVKHLPEKAITPTDHPKTDVTIYSDGACRGNPGEAGSGVAIYRKDTLSQLWFGLYDNHATNNAAELKGLHQALVFAKQEIANGNTVSIYCDSEYAIGSATKWATKWERAKWMDGTKPRKNSEIIKPIHTLFQELKDGIAIHHVRGHHGIEGNELADRMAMFAIENQESEFRLYSEPLDIEDILSFTSG